MSRGVRNLHELICVSRLSMRDQDEDNTSDDDSLSNSNNSSTSLPRVNSATSRDNSATSRDISLDSGLVSNPSTDPSPESELIVTVSNTSYNHRKEAGIVSPRSARKLRRAGNNKLVPEVITEHSTSAASSGIEVREGFVQCHGGDFDDLLTYMDGTLVSEWVVQADTSLRELAAWCSKNDNFVHFAHWWLTDFPSLDKVALIRLERGLLRDQIGFAFVAPPTGSSCRPGDVSSFLTAVFTEYPRRLLGANGPQLFLNHLDVLTSDRDDAFRQLLTNVRCATSIKQHAQWILATRSFCLVSLWSAVVNFYRQLIGDVEQNTDTGHSQSQDRGRSQDNGRSLDGGYSVILDNAAVNQTRIYAAIRRGYVDVVHYLLGSGKVPRSLLDSQHRSLVFYAVIEKQTCVLHYLLQRVKDIDVNAPASSGNTPLHAAANAGSEDIIIELLKVKRLTVDACNTECDNVTPLHVAIIHGHGAVVQLLLDAGADSLLKTGDETALSLARGLGHQDIVDIICAKQ